MLASKVGAVCQAHRLANKFAPTSSGGSLVQRRKQLAPIRRHQRMVITQEVEHLQQGLVRQAVGVAAVADEQLQQAVQGRFVLLAGEMVDCQLVRGLVVQRVLCQARLEVGSIGQAGGFGEEGQLRAGTGQVGLVLIAFDGIEHGAGFAQFAAFGQAARVEDQRGSIGVVFAEDLLEQGKNIKNSFFVLEDVKKLYLL